MILERYFYGPLATMGRLLFDGEEVWTIERPWLGNKPFESCIPDGHYLLKPFSGTKFKDVWELQNVPGRTHILIHSANWAHQLHGCIAPGIDRKIRNPSQEPTSCMVTNSRKACERVFAHIAKQEHPGIEIRSANARL